MQLQSIATYVPGWHSEEGDRTCGWDEDATTMAVAAATPLVESGDVTRIALVAPHPDSLDVGWARVLTEALGLPASTPASMRIGRAAATADLLSDARGGTLVIAVDRDPPAGAGACLVAENGDGLTVRATQRSNRFVPEVVQTPDGEVHDYGDPRLVRKLVLEPLAAAAGGDESRSLLVAGVPPSLAIRLGSQPGLARGIPVTGAAAPLFALAELVTAGDARATILALDSGASVTLEVDSGDVALSRASRQPRALPRRPGDDPEAEIPLSLAAYERAFRARVGFQGGRCACGAIDHPPRTRCLACGAIDDWVYERLPRSGEVYSVVTVHTPVPGIPGPYGIAIVSLDEIPVRVLAPVTDVPPDLVGIGSRGRLVLRRLATREGVADYGYAFSPDDQVTA